LVQWQVDTATTFTLASILSRIASVQLPFCGVGTVTSVPPASRAVLIHGRTTLGKSSAMTRIRSPDRSRGSTARAAVLMP
jgi:hypothetical protein